MINRQFQRKKKFELKKLLSKFSPPPELTVSEWADTYRMLSPEDSAEPGRWKTSRAPYQKGIMDAINQQGVEEITVMASAQVGKTAIELNYIGYFVHQDPSPIIIILPTVDMSEYFSKKRVAPMLRDSPVLRDKVKDPNKKGAENTVKEKSFPGGYMAFVGANSPSSLASRPIRIVIADEVDRFPGSAGEEGDPLSLVEKRTTTFRNRKLIRVSTPTIAGRSRIETLYNDSTMEQWCVPCPSCGELQPYEWGRINFNPVGMECNTCGTLHSEYEWKSGSKYGKWRGRQENKKHRGFHLNEFASPWVTWEEIIENFKTAKQDRETLKVWVNTSLGEAWVEEEGKELDWEVLLSRREEYEAQVPDEVLLVTGAVDIQDNRLECEVVGWGHGKESWGIQYRVFPGDPGSPQVWQDLDEFLNKEFYYGDGTPIKIASTCIDTGGHHTQSAYDFIEQRQYTRRIYAIKGIGGEGKPILNGVTQAKKNKKVMLWSLGVNALKDLTYSRLSAENGTPGYCHFPLDSHAGYGDKYFKGLTAEKKVIGMRRGKGYVEWKQMRANEQLDIRNYNTAAMEILDPNFDYLVQLKKEELSRLADTSIVESKRVKKKIKSKGVEV
jgi:phage terminase large subunit GpA-like protein